MDTDSIEVADLLSAVASRVKVYVAEVNRDIWDHIISEVPELRGDEAILAMHRASVEENVAAVLNTFESSIPVENVGSPPAALEYSRRLAQRGISVTALVRAYRMGHCRFLQWCLDELRRQSTGDQVHAAATQRMLRISFRYIDRVSEAVIEEHQVERDRWLRNQSAERAACVRALLGREQVDTGRAEETLGYRLDQNHVGIVLWLPEVTPPGEGLARLDRLTSEIAERVGCQERPLFVAQDESLAWGWLPGGETRSLSLDLVADVVEDRDPAVRVTVGAVERGTSGFCRTHRQAVRSQELAMAANPGTRVTVFESVSPIALLCADIDDTRGWVQHVLGDLAVDDEYCARLRETLYVFLTAGCSYTATASRQILHRNTVQYRVRRAEETIGKSISDRRTDLEVALLACQHLGASVLQPPLAPTADEVSHAQPPGSTA
ncbi:PucR family transcriptional regulator [Streptomyces sp. NPDC003656]